MRPCCRYFHSTLRHNLSLHLGKIHITQLRFRRFPPLGRSHRAMPQKILHQFAKRLWRVHSHIFTKKSLPGNCRAHEKSRNPRFPSGKNHGKHTGHRAYFPLQRKLADKHHRCKNLLRNHPACRQHPHGNRQIKTGTIFLQIRRRQIHRHLFDRKKISGIPYRRLDTLLRLLHGNRRQPDNIKSR